MSRQLARITRQELSYGYLTWEERQLKGAVRTLKEKAHHLHEQLERYTQDPRHSRSDLNQLVSAVNQVQNLSWNVHMSYTFTQKLNQIQNALNQIRPAYGMRTVRTRPVYRRPNNAHGGYYNRNGRYDTRVRVRRGGHNSGHGRGHY